MKIIADENIPLLNECFGTIGDIVTLPGRAITANDVKSADAIFISSSVGPLCYPG